MKAIIKSCMFSLAVISAFSVLCLVVGGGSMVYMFLAASLAIVANDIIDSIDDKILEG